VPRSLSEGLMCSKLPGLLKALNFFFDFSHFFGFYT
jgi:hypothetical protein